MAETGSAPDRRRAVGHILVVEDEAGFQTLLSEALSRAGHQVTAAYTGLEGLDLIRQQAFDLLLIDNRLPGLSGLALLQQLRAMGQSVPVIIMTAYADVPIVVEAMRLQAVDFLVKPFHLETLLPRVERYLRAAASARAAHPLGG
jgi:DNA-binding response OmpR family regulator